MWSFVLHTRREVHALGPMDSGGLGFGFRDCHAFSRDGNKDVQDDLRIYDDSDEVECQKQSQAEWRCKSYINIKK